MFTVCIYKKKEGVWTYIDHIELKRIPQVDEHMTFEDVPLETPFCYRVVGVINRVSGDSDVTVYLERAGSQNSVFKND